MTGLTLCTLVLQFNYGKPEDLLGSVWLFNGDGVPDLESSDPLGSTSGWTRLVGPIDYNAAAKIHASLKKFLEESGVTVIDEGVAD